IRTASGARTASVAEDWVAPKRSVTVAQPSSRPRHPRLGRSHPDRSAVALRSENNEPDAGGSGAQEGDPGVDDGEPAVLELLLGGCHLLDEGIRVDPDPDEPLRVVARPSLGRGSEGLEVEL